MTQPTLLTLEIAPAYGAELCEARRLTTDEGKEYAAWYRKIGLVGIGQHVKVNEQIAMQLVDGRKSDGQFPGCDNRAYIITQAEWDYLLSTIPQSSALPLTLEEVAINEHRSDTIALAKQDSDNQHHPGYCSQCHTYCYGDCEAN